MRNAHTSFIPSGGTNPGHPLAIGQRSATFVEVQPLTDSNVAARVLCLFLVVVVVVVAFR